VGAQGDEWDAQKDMALALSGAAISMLVTTLYRRYTDREPWRILASQPSTAEPTDGRRTFDPPRASP
jgi:hypothetical protein